MTPLAAKKPCSRPECGKLTHARFCDEHRKQEHRNVREQRGSTTERGYGWDWQRATQLYRKTHPFCADPYNVHGGWPVLAKHVDHIVPIRLAPERRLDPDNWQHLCTKCHNSLKQKEEIALKRMDYPHGHSTP
jgi:5-methylcytosine-specific restriction enzyme A